MHLKQQDNVYRIVDQAFLLMKLQENAFYNAHRL